VKVKCGGLVHRKTREAVLGNAHMEELTWSRDYGPKIMWTTVDALWGPVFGPDGTGLAKLWDDDKFVELGCGQGGVLLAAHRAAPGCRIIGIELDSATADIARAQVSAACHAPQGEQLPVTVLCGEIDDYLEASPAPLADAPAESSSASKQDSVFPISQATFVFMFLSQYACLRLRPRLLSALPIGARILVRRFTLGKGWPPDDECSNNDNSDVFRLYTVTAERKEDPILLANEELENEYALLRARRPDHSAF